MSVSEQLASLAASPKVAGAVSAATAATGVGTWIDWIPDEIGKLATLVGILLSLLLIYSHSITVRKSRIELRRMLAEDAARSEAPPPARTDAGEASA